MLKFINGGAGSGKTTAIYDEIVKKQQTFHGTILLFVPDQFEFETEKAIAEKLNGRCLNVKVTGFTKLADEILNKLSPNLTYANDAAKEIIMYRVLNEIKDTLNYYGRAAGKIGFCDMMLNAVKQFKAEGLTTEFVDEFLDNNQLSPVLKEKMTELSYIYSAYNSALSATYADRQDNLISAARLALENDWFAGCELYIDSFDSFSGEQLCFLQPMIEQSTNSTIALTIEDGKSCFNNTVKTMERLIRFAQNQHAEIKTIKMETAYRYKSPEIKHLRDSFGAGSDVEIKAFDGKNNAVKIVQCDDVYAESEYTASEICRLVKEKDYSYKDIVVLMKEPEKYAVPLESTFEKYNIPVFLDLPQRVIDKPLVKLVLFALQAAETLETEDIVRYIKSGFVRIKNSEEAENLKPLSFSKINLIEEFVNKWGIRSRDWLSPFPLPKEMQQNQQEIKEITILNHLREEIMTPLLWLRKHIQNKTGSEITKALCEFLFDKIDINASIQGKCQDYTTESLRYNKALTEEYNQLWDMLVTIFETAFTAMENYPVSVKSYIQILKQVFSKTNFALPPQVLDSTLAGSTDRTRTANARAVFILGANEGVFPALSKVSGAFTSKELEELISKGMELSENREGRYINELLSVYKTLSLPEEYLYISYPLISIGGETLMKSTVVDEILSLFKDTDIIIASDIPYWYFCRSERSAKEYYARNFRKDNQAKLELEQIFADDKTLNIKLKSAMKLQGKEKHIHRLSQYSAKKLFAAHTLSPTAVKDMNSCGFACFCKRGLKIQSTTEKTLNHLEVGNIIHFCLERVFSTHTAEDLKATDKAVLTSEVKGYLEAFKETQFLGGFGKTKRFDCLYNNICGIIIEFINQFVLQIENSNFKPKFFELCLNDRENAEGIEIAPFSFKVQDLDRITVGGNIDRVDVMENENEKYIRIIDYKTGNTTFDLGEVYYGINLQMLLYLFALSENPKNKLAGIKPSSVLYFPANEGDFSVQRSDNEKDVLKNWLKNHKQTGLVIRNNAYDDLNASNSRIKDSVDGDSRFNIFHVSELEQEDFENLKEHCERLLSENYTALRKGEIPASAVMGKKTKPCAYCEYKDFCGGDDSTNIKVQPEKIREILPAYNAELLAKEEKAKSKRKGQS